jgi:hypothetical protein
MHWRLGAWSLRSHWPYSMRLLPLFRFATLAAFLLGPSAALFAADTATAAVIVNAQFSSRTSLKVSTEILQFDVATPDQPATAAVEFSAGARTPAGAEVVLSVERVRGVEGPGGAADVDASLTFSGESDGTLGGAVATGGPTVAGRWIGSGIRNGRLVFELRASASGRYTVPMRFVLSAP